MTLPLILSTQQAHLALQQSDRSVRPIDLRSAEAYADGHLDGAVRIEPALLNRKQGAIAGLLPEPSVVNRFLREAGVNPGEHVLAYDAGASTEAARLIWVLHVYGFMQTSWLDGGFGAWQSDALPVTRTVEERAPGTLELEFTGRYVTTPEAVMNDLAESHAGAILDVRSAAEFEGSDVRSARGGHIPGADHQEWTRVFAADGRLLDDATLRSQFGDAVLNNPDGAIVYCQSHQRSSVTYLVLRHLGLDSVRAIDGAWSNWGNRDDTPIDTGTSGAR